LVRPSQGAASIVLPIHAKAGAVGAPLPGHRLIQVKSPAWTERGGGLTNGQRCLRNGYSGRANTQAARAVLFHGRKLIVAEEEVRKTEIIHERRTKYARNSQHALVDPR